MNVLEVKELKKKYKNFQAVDSLSLSVKKGEIHGILGPNGAGKSTTICCILGLVSYDSGKIIFDEKYSLREWRRYIGYVPQELAIYDELSAEQNVKFFCSLYGIKDIKTKVDRALDFVGLNDVRKKKAGTFSGGMKRRLNLACGIVHEPKLVIMDEPTVGIDPQSRNRILENVKSLNENGTSVIYTSHYMPEIEQICSRMTVVDHGRFITAGTKQEICSSLQQYTVLKITYSGQKENVKKAIKEIEETKGVIGSEFTDCKLNVKFRNGFEVFDDIFKILSENAVKISDIATEEPSLEETFLNLTGKELRDNVCDGQ